MPTGFTLVLIINAHVENLYLKERSRSLHFIYTYFQKKSPVSLLTLE